MARLLQKAPGAPPTLLLLAAFLFFFATTAHAASAVLGVDLGTEYIKAALVKPGIPLEIVLTKDSRRKETAAVAFKPVKDGPSGGFPERVYGSDAIALSARFPGDVYPNLKPLLGLSTSNSLVQEYATRHPALKMEAEKTRGTAAFKSGAFSADEEAWMVEEILAMELQSIQRNAEALAGKGSVIKDLVITIPAFYTAEEKRAIELAAEFAGLRILSLISDGVAVGLNYATSRTFPSIEEGGKPEHHLVFDMGAGSTKATVLRFQGRTVKDVGKFNKTIQEVHALGNGWDRTLGGDALNAVIVDDMVAKFVASPAAKSISPTVEAVKSHGRATAKLWKEAERIRQVLSANNEAQGSFEGLYEDIDFRYKISRAEFEQLAETHAERVAEPIKKALAVADLEIEDLDSIILHGGAIRTPFVQKALEKIVGDADKIRTNVNADEAAVFGAAFKGAGLSPSFRVKEIKSYEAAVYPVGHKWIDIYDKPQHLRTFHAHTSLGSATHMSFMNQDDFTIRFYQHVPSSENVSPGSAEKDIITLTTKNLNASVTNCKEKYGCTDGDIRMHLNYHLAVNNGLPEITNVTLHCEVDEVESDKKGSVVDGVKGLFGFGSKAQEPLGAGESSDEPVETPSSSSSDAEAKFAAAVLKDSKEKTARRTEIIHIDYVVENKGLPQLPNKEIVRVKHRMIDFDDSDRSRRQREEALNQLEGFTYRARDLLTDESFIEASTEQEREHLEKKSQAASDWLYGDGAEASRDDLKARLKELKAIVNPILKRREESSKRPEAIKSFEEALDRTKSIMKSINEQIEKAEKAASSTTETSTEAPAPSSADDFEGLEDEETTTTSSSKKAAPTPAALAYTTEDVNVLSTIYVNISTWFQDNVAKQAKVAVTEDPVLLVKDLAAKMQELDKAGTELLMKGIKAPGKPKKSSSKSGKASKSKAAKSSKSSASAKAKQTLDFEDSEKPFFKVVGENDEMPSEEEILDAIRRSKERSDEAEKAHDEL
jgi:hypoxia up-regulated 1